MARCAMSLLRAGRLGMWGVTCLICGSLWAGEAAPVPKLGQPIAESEVISLTIYTDGRGLPAGSGTATEGRRVFQTHCLACHGVDGSGGVNGDLVGGDWPHKRTIGSFWPYASTLFDYIRRAMPYPNAGSLSADETYAVVAFLLERNDVIGLGDEMNASTLSRVVMPARRNFVSDYPLPK